MTDNLQAGIGDTPDGTPVFVDLDKLIGSHLAAAATTGGGKSGAVRKVLEATAGHVQQIILDPEDDFFTLREKFDYLVAGGEGGDAPATVANARPLARAVLEYGFSLIVQLNDLRDDEPAIFIREFIDELLAAPRSQWGARLVVLDEAQLFAPSSAPGIASAAIKDLMRRGRKRGFTAILAATRVSDLDAAVRGMVKNWLFGPVGTSLDRRTAADQLGFTGNSAEGRSLQTLETREFYAFGPALTRQPTLFRIGDVATTILKHGQSGVPMPPAPEALRGILAALAEAAKPAETPAISVGGQPVQVFEPGDSWVPVDQHDRVSRLSEARGIELGRARAALWDLSKRARELGEAVPLDLIVHEGVEPGGPSPEPIPPSEVIVPPLTPEQEAQFKKDMQLHPGGRIEMLSPDDAIETCAPQPTGRALDILQMLVLSVPVGKSITEKAWAMRCGVNRKSSTWRGYKAALRGWFIKDGDRVSAPNHARAITPHVPGRHVPTGRQLVEYYQNELGSGPAAVLKVLLDAWPGSVGRQMLANLVGTDASKSTFRGYIAPLSTLELIEKHGDAYQLAAELMMEE